MKNKIRKTCLIAISMLLILIAAGCGNKAAEDKKTEESGSENNVATEKNDGASEEPKSEDAENSNSSSPKFAEDLEKIKVEGGSLAAILTTPTSNISKELPVVLIVPGSGSPPKNGIVNEFENLSQRLAEKGIATLRYDKRGTYDSNNISVNEADLKIQTYVDDVTSLLKHLKANKRFSKVYLLGHSEGGLIGALAIDGEPVDGFISVSAAGRPIGEIIKEQIANNPANPIEILQEANGIIDKLQRDERVKEVSPALQSLFRESAQNYIADWMKYNPMGVYSKIKDIKTLIIQGTNDIQTSVADAKKLKEATPDAELVLIEKMSHVLKDAASKDNLALHATVYQNVKDPVNDELVEKIAAFINQP